MTPILPADVARCRPTYCLRRDACARALAPVPAHGGSLVDGSKQWGGDPCAGYIAPSSCGEAPAPARRVHPPLGAI